MELSFSSYPFTRVLGWSISRYDLFDKCRRAYFYQYYARFARDIPEARIKRLGAMTSVPLEMGTVTHEVIEAFLRRLQKSTSDIDENRFYSYALQRTEEIFSKKTFMEIYYGRKKELDMVVVNDRITTMLKNFLEGPLYSWLCMKAITNRDNWMIEPEGYGETRLDGMKAYCKMDFLFPVDKEVYILDWKTGRKDPYKHRMQLIAYAAAAASNFGLSHDVFFPKIVYLHPHYDELEFRITPSDLDDLFQRVRAQTNEMKSFCSDPENNIPRAIDEFPMMPSEQICNNCQFFELCFKSSGTASVPEF